MLIDARLGRLAAVAVTFSTPVTTSVRAAKNRHLLLSQIDWPTHRGVYLSLENAGDDAIPLSVGGMKLVLAVGDGTAWRFAAATPMWTFGKPYAVVARIDAKTATLTLDGREIARIDGAALAPADREWTGNEAPAWASAPMEVEVVERSARVTSRGREVASHVRPDVDAARDPVANLFARRPLWHVSNWRPAAGEPVQIEIAFSLERTIVDLHAVSPVIDRFGQAGYGRWPTKVADDAQLKADVAAEQTRLATMPPPTDVDEYGGSRSPGWSGQSTGFYRVTKRDGKWWLVTPTGRPVFYTGICTAPMLTGNGTPVKGREYLFAELPPNDGAFAPAWGRGVWGETDNTYFAFDTANLIRKFGDDWQQKAEALTAQRVRAFGFAGLGKWSEPIAGVPYVGCLFHPADPPSGKSKLDVFDPAARERFVATMREQVEPRKNDPFLVGWSVGSERPETVLNDDLAAMLAAPGATPAKVALVRRAIETIYGNDVAKCARAWKSQGATPEGIAALPLIAPMADVEPLRYWYADAYYKFVYDTVKSIDASHLYLGYWIVPGWWQNESDWSLIAAHCDVIGYDRYADAFVDDWTEALMRKTDKPVLCGEFGYPPTYDGRRGVGAFPLVTTPDEKASGEAYARWIAAASKNPWCVGGLWFEYRDQPITGRGPGQGPNLIYDEHYAFGIVDVVDRPKWDLVERMRAANLKATADRAAR